MNSTDGHGRGFAGRMSAIAGVRVTAWLASEAIGLSKEYCDGHDYDEPEVQAAAVAEVVEGASADLTGAFTDGAVDGP